ncbi:S1 RNA-binding domain-containing protein [Pseudolysinimonas sp.]|uniref:S1 RNA-binding domain-containing protein n=1 Tax=Pseudolysinimonas sp. TaxID=2680009 RepID=UPI0037C8D3B2
MEIIPGKDGLCHISELAEEYVNSVHDICSVGDELDVKVIAIDEQVDRDADVGPERQLLGDSLRRDGTRAARRGDFCDRVAEGGSGLRADRRREHPGGEHERATQREARGCRRDGSRGKGGVGRRVGPHLSEHGDPRAHEDQQDEHGDDVEDVVLDPGHPLTLGGCQVLCHPFGGNGRARSAAGGRLETCSSRCARPRAGCSRPR